MLLRETAVEPFPAHTRRPVNLPPPPCPLAVEGSTYRQPSPRSRIRKHVGKRAGTINTKLLVVSSSARAPTTAWAEASSRRPSQAQRATTL
jgi:hypothetical protein